MTQDEPDGPEQAERTRSSSASWALRAIFVAVMTPLAGVAVARLTHTDSSSGTRPPPTTLATSGTSSVVPVPAIQLPTEVTPPASDGSCPRDTELSIKPTSGPANTIIEVAGTGFDAGEPIDISFGGQLAGPAHTNLNCSFAGVKIPIPEFFSHFPGTSFDVTATGQRSIRHARKPFMLTK